MARSIRRQLSFGVTKPLPIPADLPETETATEAVTRPGRPHLVVVTTRAVQPADKAPNDAVLVTRFWHPRDQRWSENYFESLEHARRLFVDESGWVLRQEQSLDAPQVWELIFEARREDFSGPSTQQILEDVGLNPQAVEGMLKQSGKPKA
jgi:nicotinamidase-related amidase